MHTPTLPHPTPLPTLRLSSIPLKPLHWLWHQRIPRGKITLLAGDPATGKTALALHLASQLSRGLPPNTTNTTNAPNTTDTTNSPQSTLLLSPEDNPADTLRPKLEAMHANLDLIHLLPNFHSLIPEPHRNPDADPLPTPLERLDHALSSIPNLALLVIDPITHYLGLSDKKLRNAHSSTILHELARLAEKHNIAILLTTRLTKSLPTLPTARQATPASILHRTLGSLAFATTARSVLLLLPNTTDHPALTPNTTNTTNTTNNCPPPTHLLATVKSNLTSPPPILPFTLTDTISFHPEEIPPDQLASLCSPPPRQKPPGPPDTSAQEAAAWLKTALANGPVKATSLLEDARKNLISPATLKRAKTLLNIESAKQDWSGKWFWKLPNDTRPLPENPMERTIAKLADPELLRDFLSFPRPKPGPLREKRPQNPEAPDPLRDKPQKPATPPNANTPASTPPGPPHPFIPRQEATP